MKLLAPMLAFIDAPFPGLAGHVGHDFWRAHAPRTTHLRMSCIRAPLGRLNPSLASSVGIALTPDLPPPASKMYPAVRALVLHQDASTEADMARPATIEAYAQLMASLEHFANVCPTQGVKTVVVPPFYMYFEDWGERLRDEWLDRISGGPGCWRELMPVARS
ncbi:hypothetical protein C2E23DRAFT_855422 [Lenzites betulinus]|nr:hypothetical protein C2E23DRAFT_855422 [Lenzites betulinus]